MSIGLTATRTRLNNIVDVPITGTTSADGATDMTTAVDASLASNPDNKFEDWYLYPTVAAEERCIKSFLSPSGTITVYEAFTAQVETAIAFSLYRYPNADKLIALNQALYDVYPKFYARLWDTTLYGQNDYNEESNEFDKFIYTVPAAFTEFPTQIWLQPAYIGDHTGSDDASALTDANASWTINELVGFTIYNKTDGSSGTVTANTSTTVTATLADGTDHDWDEDDEYIVQKPDKIPIRFYKFKVIDRADIASFEFHADIAEGYIIALAGRGQLTQFTDEASTTELTNDQARIFCFKAAANLLEMYLGKVDAQDAVDMRNKIAGFEWKYSKEVEIKRMPSLQDKMGVDFSWSN